jgi:putative DNA primase/helicase
VPDKTAYDPMAQLLELALEGSSKAAAALSEGQQKIAFMLADKYADSLRFSTTHKWLYWTGKYWKPDDGAQAHRLLTQVLLEAGTSHNAEQSKAAKATMNDSARKGVLSIASYLPQFRVQLEDLDADPYLLNVQNGTYDLRTAELRDHDPADLITKITNAAYDVDAKGLLWSEHLEYFQPQLDVREFLQRFFGYALLGAVREHVLLVCYGPQGANGKSTTDRAIQFTLGDYALAANQNLLVASQRNSADSASPARFALLGKRYVSMSETEARAPIAEALMKNLTGGDKVSARALFKDEITFEPSHTLALYTNHKPKFTGDPAVWRRVKLVPFDITRPLADRDPMIDEKLRLEADAILTWMIDGYAAWLSRGHLDAPASVEAATDEYQYEEDTLAQFLTECISAHPGSATGTKEIWAAYTDFANENQLEHVTQKDLYQRLENEGYPRARKSTGYVFRNLVVNDPIAATPKEMLE